MDNRWRPLELTLAVIGAVLGIAPMVLPQGTTLLRALGIAAAVILITIAVGIAMRRPGQLVSSAVPTKFSFEPATPDELHWIASLEERQFQKDAVPLDILLEWYAANPNGFLIIRDSRQEKIGHLDVLPVREEPFRLFLKGTITELGLRGTSLIGPEARSEARDLYVESVIVLGDRENRKSAVSAMLSSLDDIFAHVAEPANIRYIYGLAATQAGEDFLKRWDFEVVSKAENRKDKHPLYRALYSELKARLYSYRAR
jgi:hypothetical protein